jgi:hypothetical protein
VIFLCGVQEDRAKTAIGGTRCKNPCVAKFGTFEELLGHLRYSHDLRSTRPSPNACCRNLRNHVPIGERKPFLHYRCGVCGRFIW